MMTPKEIIAEAWHLTTREKKIFRWGFGSALFETLFDFKLYSYQIYFAWSMIVLNEPVGFFKVEQLVLEHLPFWMFLVFVTGIIILFVVEIFVPKLCLGAIIGLAAKSHKGEEVKGGLVLALYNFFRIFAVREIFFLAKLGTVLTISSLVIRYMGGDIAVGFSIFLLVLWFVSLIMRFFASFAEEAIVIHKKGIFSSIKKSIKLIISHLSHVVFLMILLLVISLRILLNAIVIFVIPGLILGLGFLLSSFLPLTVTVMIAAIVGLIVILIASYFLAYIEVFKQTAWTITYMELSKLKELDVIEAEPEPGEEVTEEENAGSAGSLPAEEPDPTSNETT